MKIILLNGPPRCGKDTAAELLRTTPKARTGYFVRCTKLAARLKNMTHAAFGWEEVSHDSFEAVKDQPCEELMGCTPRKAYIQMSEGFLKPLLGPGALGKMLSQDIRAMGWNEHSLFTVSDSGFREEAEELAKAFGAENILLVRMHRQGTSFQGDSRGYITLVDLGVPEVDINNDGTEEQLREELLEAMVLTWK